MNVAQLTTVNAQGQVTAVSNHALATASSSVTGVLSAADWNTFNGKENVLTFSDGLTRTETMSRSWTAPLVRYCSVTVVILPGCAQIKSLIQIQHIALVQVFLLWVPPSVTLVS